MAATGLILLSTESILTLSVFLWVVGLSWIGVIWAGKNVFRKNSMLGSLLFALLLIGQLAPLFYYKYWDFILNEWLGLDLRKPSVLIPMGLSFYTFQKIGFWIDSIKRPESRPRFLDYLNFCSFFPQIVAGPIERKESLLPQIEKTSFKIDRTAIDAAARWIVLGLGYKLIVADNIGTLSETFQVNSGNAWHVWFECFAFAVRIYFDFAGYSFIAVGLGLLFGVQLTMNFNQPYWSSNLRDFWKNWHITLGSWLRDYIYIPLGGRRSSFWIVNVLIVFLISGIWHGAGWGFLIWGLLHGIGVAFCGVGKPWAKLGPLRWFFTFAYTTAAWLFFFEGNEEAMKAKAISLFSPEAYGLATLRQFLEIFPNPAHCITTLMILLLASVFLGLEGLDMKLRQEPYHLCRKPLASMILVFLCVFLAPMEQSRFIYFNF